MTSQLTLYVDGYFASPYDGCCMVALVEKQVPFQTARALLREGQRVPVALKNRTVIARVPALQHGEFWLTESLAIAEYLEDAFPPPAYPRIFPADHRARARVRQIMAWLRTDIIAVRQERPWWMTLYPTMAPPLSEAATREASELVELIIRLGANGELAEWSIAHADLAFALLRLARTEYPLPASVGEFLDAQLARPSIRAYLEHPRPPHRPP